MAEALLVQGTALRNLGRFADALDVYRRIIDRYGANISPEVRPVAVAALLNRGVTLGDMGRFREAAAVYRQIIGSHRGDPILGVLVERAEACLRGVPDGARA